MGGEAFFHFYSADIHLHLFCVSHFNNLRFYTWCCWSGWTFGIPCLPLPPCCYNYGAYTDVTVERSAVLFLMWTAFSGYDRSHTTPKVADYVSYALSVVQFLFCFRVPQRAPRLTHQVAPCGGWRWCLGARGLWRIEPLRWPLHSLVAFSLPSKYVRNVLIQEHERVRGSAPCVYMSARHFWRQLKQKEPKNDEAFFISLNPDQQLEASPGG